MTPPKEHIKLLYDYMQWIDNDVRVAAQSLADEAYYREQNISLGSVHKLLVHGMAAQWIWLQRWQGVSPTSIDSEVQYPTRASLDAQWPKVHKALHDFLDAQTPATLAAPVTWTRQGQQMSTPLGLCMVYVADHATYHRGQINSMIKLAGGKPSVESMIRYLTLVRKF